VANWTQVILNTHARSAVSSVVLKHSNTTARTRGARSGGRAWGVRRGAGARQGASIEVNIAVVVGAGGSGGHGSGGYVVISNLISIWAWERERLSASCVVIPVANTVHSAIGRRRCWRAGGGLSRWSRHCWSS
jgi:hypothetical protein